MNHACQLMGHDWGRWRWVSGYGSKWTPHNGSSGPGHHEERRCLRLGCGGIDVEEDRPGMLGCDRCYDTVPPADPRDYD